MCVVNPQRIDPPLDSMKGWKVMEVREGGVLRTPFYAETVPVGKEVEAHGLSGGLTYPRDWHFYGSKADAVDAEARLTNESTFVLINRLSTYFPRLVVMEISARGVHTHGQDGTWWQSLGKSNLRTKVYVARYITILPPASSGSGIPCS